MRYHMRCREEAEINSMELKRRKKAMEKNLFLLWKEWARANIFPTLIHTRVVHWLLIFARYTATYAPPHAPIAYGEHMHDGCFEWAQKKVVKMSKIAGYIPTIQRWHLLFSDFHCYFSLLTAFMHEASLPPFILCAICLFKSDLRSILHIYLMPLHDDESQFFQMWEWGIN